jgi:cytochrome oxidase Cu insertion factor (SCO1/SenC/PrrC family)
VAGPGRAAPLVLALALPAAARPASDAQRPLDFVPPAPGTYVLHHIMPAPDGNVLTVEGGRDRLSRFTRAGRITLLGFIYTTCIDPQGCPLAYQVFDRLKAEIQATPLAREVQFVTLSFDPARDTPSVMKHYAGSRLEDEGGLRWYFLTTPSVEDLMPLVEGFGQDVRYSVNRSTGRPVRELSHVLKVFLIDGRGDVREIYTSVFLHPRSILGDIQTLLMDPAR